jgi:hypothetical protein
MVMVMVCTRGGGSACCCVCSLFYHSLVLNFTSILYSSLPLAFLTLIDDDDDVVLCHSNMCGLAALSM